MNEGPLRPNINFCLPKYKHDSRCTFLPYTHFLPLLLLFLKACVCPSSSATPYVRTHTGTAFAAAVLCVVHRNLHFSHAPLLIPELRRRRRIEACTANIGGSLLLLLLPLLCYSVDENWQEMLRRRSEEASSSSWIACVRNKALMLPNGPRPSRIYSLDMHLKQFFIFFPEPPARSSLFL